MTSDSLEEELKNTQKLLRKNLLAYSNLEKRQQELGKQFEEIEKKYDLKMQAVINYLENVSELQEVKDFAKLLKDEWFKIKGTK